ncbi:hypothetical protein KIH87_15410 [Paraneptunicella aestuarii]|uniref:M12 family metallo-peptidase n=1 Tax=Paraneptunicella aestuarii TaxID=2831148 RepID=UPI001E3F7894|nr:M12 family metallo-peptidase [Paraneptunicella aestuarii]UAA38065.1 hypothetical protein KIH87_15410 [Paraneptunicella aestuarii]
MKKSKLATAFIACISISPLIHATPLNMELNTQVQKETYNNDLFTYETSRSSSISESPVYLKLVNDPNVISVQQVNINTSAIDGASSTLNLNLGPGMTFTAKNSESYWLSSKYQAWTGYIETGVNSTLQPGEKKLNLNHINLVKNNNRVRGQFNIGDRNFEIRTTEEGAYILTELNYLNLLEEDLPNDMTQLKGEEETSSRVSSELSPSATSATIRIMQIATPEAVSAEGGQNSMLDRMYSHLSITNQIYANNGLSITVQNAGMYNTGTSELSNFNSNLTGLVNTSDGYLDDFAGYIRDVQGADVVALIAHGPSSGLCGRASAIKASASNAFFIMSTGLSCEYTKSFTHELGHLFGARHDAAHDSSTSPYAYGHGYVNTGAGIRSIMATNSNPGTRILMLSTDDQTYSGATIGTAALEDNERVHDVRKSVMAGFR